VLVISGAKLMAADGETLPVETIVTNATAPVETTATAPETSTPAPANVPAPPAHDPWVVRQAVDLGIPAEEVAGMSGPELSRSVYLLNKQRSALAQQFAQPKPVETPKPAEPDFAFPDALKAKLSEFDPAIVEAVEFAAKAGVDRAKKAEAEVAVARQQIASQNFARQVAAAMEKIPAQQREVVFQKLCQLEQSGELPPNTPPEIAVPLAHKALLQAFGIQAAAPAASPPPPPPAPTPTARPTNRFAKPDGKESSDIRKELLELYSGKLQQWDDEDAAAGERNGNMLP
jgi:hypothetical protein